MANLKLFLLGPPRVELNGGLVNIKRRKALAMLIYLAVNSQAYSRDALATLFYPDYSQSRARAYLRRDLAVLNTSLAGDWIDADRETVQFNEDGDLWLDVTRFRACLAECDSHNHAAHLPSANCMSLLTEAVELYTDDFLAGFTLRDCPEFDEWQFFQAESLRQQLATALERLVQGGDQGDRPEAAIPHARRWVALDPLHEPAQRALIQLYDRSEQTSAALRQYEEYAALLEEELGLPPEEETQTLYEAIKAKRMLKPYVRQADEKKRKGDRQKRNRASQETGYEQVRPGPVQAGENSLTSRPSPAPLPAEPPLELEQKIQFCTSFDGTRLAYATAGQGPPLVKAANWLSHLEYDWQSPVWRHWLAGLAQSHTLVRYDKRGCGLSDRDVDDFSLSAQVRDLETVVEALGLERFPLLGLSGGGPVAIAYTARHPEKVSSLILYGSYARGRLKRNQTLEQLEEAQMLFKAMELGWGRANPAFRQLYTGLFIPEGTADQIHWYNELQRISTSPEIAVRMFKASASVDVTDLAPQVSVPTLILHADQDALTRIDQSRELAELIPDARFVPLESKNHILLEHEPAWAQFLDEVRQFLQADRIEQDDIGARSFVDSSSPPGSEKERFRSELPAQPTPFIGREDELAEIRRLLVKEPDCRLLTLVGPGGIGKTRLALAAGAQGGTAFVDGAYFVSLASVDGIEFIVPAIAEALQLNFQGETEPKIQLLNYIRSKNLLLIVDNFEHLLPGADLLSEMLQAAPHLSLLVTSRERLSVQEEWSYGVQGLPFPQNGEVLAADPDQMDHYSALQLFLQRAKMANANFAYSADDMAAIIRICQLVEGMPLGIELAAPWVRLMSCGEIAEEIERNFDLLASSLQNVPERHRSLRAIFEQTWASLSEAEQGILSQLSIFRGGCLREAAEVVTGATLPLLGSLMDKALLRRTDGGRYDMHELIRQFALAQLQGAPDTYTKTLDRHCRYYTSFLQQQVDGLKGGSQLETFRGIAAEIDNVRAAWQRAVETKDSVALDQAAECLYLYSEMGGALAEGERAFRSAAAAIAPNRIKPSAEDTIVKGFLLVGQGTLRAHRGDLEEGYALLEQGLSLLGQVKDQKQHLQKKAFALMWQGWLLFLQAKNTEVERIIHESLDLYTKAGDLWGVAKSLFVLGNSLTGSGRLAEAESPLRKSLAICQEIDDRRSRLLVDRNLAIQTFWFGDYDQTDQLLNEAALLSREFNDQIGLAYALREIGKLEVARGDYSQAIRTLRESIAITDEIGSQWESAATLDDLGVALCLSGDFGTAENVLRQCLEASKARHHRYFTARCLGDLGLVAYHRGEHSQAEKNLRQALNIWTELGHEPYRAWVLGQLGHALRAMDESRQAEARQYYRQALQLSIKHRLAPFALDVFVALAGPLRQIGQLENATALLDLAEHHPASTAETKERARRHLVDLDVDVHSEKANAAKTRGQTLDWQEKARWLIDTLARPIEPKSQAPPNLPVQPTPFIGREKEMSEIKRLLVDDPNCRLLTLVGPGGIGKTRLALQAAAEVSSVFPDGVYFVPLASTSGVEYIVPAIAQVLEITFQGELEPRAQLLHYLRNKKLLLVMDNFEHLLSGTEVVREILQDAPQVKLLTTSRERLNLQEEWNYVVHGMPFPQTIESSPGEESKVEAEYGAIQLFLQRARQADANFDYSAEDMPYIVRICQLVDGMPLGLELAAPWVRLMSCQEIAEEIERNFDVLATSLQNVPERHRSLRAIFEQTWTRLSKDEKIVLSKLSIFWGGCLIDAAKAVTGATLTELSSLVDRALLHRTSDGRYEMHELVRQFAAAQLQQEPVEFEEAQDRHSNYYTRFLRRQIPKLKGDSQKKALAEIAADLDNVRAAWRRATDHNDIQSLAQGAESLWFFGEFQGALFEIDTLFEQTVTALTSTATASRDPEPAAERESLIGFLLAAQGYLRARQHKLEEGHALVERGLARLRQAISRDRQKEAYALIYLEAVLHFQGRFAEAKRVAEESLALLSEIGDRWNEAWGLFLLGASAQWGGQLEEAEHYLQKSKAICGDLDEFLVRSWNNLELALVALKRGEYARAKHLLDEALQIKQEFRDPLGTADVLRDLSRLAIAKGDYEQAIELMQKSVAIFSETGGEWVVAARLGYLGTAFRLQGDFERAATYLQESLTSSRTSGQKPDMARNLSQLGCLAYDRQAFQEAKRLQQEALAIWEEIGNEPEIASVLRYLGHISAKSIDHQETKTRQYYQRALQLALSQKVAPVSLDVFVGVASLLAGRGERQKALELLFLVQDHSASTAETKETSRRYQAELTTDLSPEVVNAAKARGETLDWETMAEQLITEISDAQWGKLPTQATALLHGTAGERFQLEKPIATGGMGEVYLGQDVETGLPVAIKRLRPDLVAQNPEALNRFLREGEMLRQLNHPNIVKVLATLEDKDQPVIVMEYVAGGSLQDLLDRQPRLPLERVLNIGLELADALTRVHHLGIIHRDLKPGNVLLAEDNTPRLTDFGVASLLQPDSRLTQEGTILGTSAYLSPEAWRGETLDACSDIWSFGAVLYEILAGRPPFVANNAVAIMTAILHNPLPNLTQFRPDTPPALVELIEHMLVKERTQRLDSMRQVAAGLETINRTIAPDRD